MDRPKQFRLRYLSRLMKARLALFASVAIYSVVLLVGREYPGVAMILTPVAVCMARIR